MKDILYLGSSPSDENCAQIGDEDFEEKNISECKRYISLLKDIFGEPPEGSSFKIKKEEHDFGFYREVVISYDEDYPESVEYAFNVEGNIPKNWK